MNGKHPQNPAQQLIAAIDAHVNSPLVRMSPLASVLPLLRQYILTTEEEQSAARDRDTVLARAILERHFGRETLPPDVYASIATMARIA